MHVCKRWALARLVSSKQAGCYGSVRLVASARDPTAMKRRSLLAGIVALPLFCEAMAGNPLEGGHTSASTHRAAATGSWRMLPFLNTTHERLIQNLRDEGLIRSPRVMEALLGVDRAFYINTDYASEVEAYQDHPLRIGHGQTISAPHMHAICLSLLEPQLQPGATALDVGSGSGYLTAAMAKLVGPAGHVLGVEQVPELVEDAWGNVARGNPELLEEGEGPGEGEAPRFDMRVLNVLGGDAGDVLAPLAPFDAIHVGAAAADLPQGLVDLMKPGGRMIIPVGAMDEPQVLMQVDKDAAGEVTVQEIMGVGYVPLTPPGRERQGYTLF